MIPFLGRSRRSRERPPTPPAQRVEACSTLEYAVEAPATFLFQVAVVDNEHQRLVEESFETEPGLDVELCQVGPSGNRMMRLVAGPGPLAVRYRALVDLVQDAARPADLVESAYADLPPEVLPYLNPSRYCQSDELAELAWREFGPLAPGHGRVSAIVDWVHERMSYVPGSTGPSTTALDVLETREGVCRDYAHLAIALCRALGIPARYVAGYAVDLEPPDFHGFCEVWLGDAWYLFDATRLAPVSGFVRIGTGRDAADASFATIVGPASATAPPQVIALRVGDDPCAERPTVPEEALSTA